MTAIGESCSDDLGLARGRLSEAGERRRGGRISSEDLFGVGSAIGRCRAQASAGASTTGALRARSRQVLWPWLVTRAR